MKISRRWEYIKRNEVKEKGSDYNIQQEDECVPLPKQIEHILDKYFELQSQYIEVKEKCADYEKDIEMHETLFYVYNIGYAIIVLLFALSTL